MARPAEPRRRIAAITISRQFRREKTRNNMKELTKSEMECVTGGDWIDIAAGVAGVLVGAALSATGVGAIGAGVAGVAAADFAETIMRDMSSSTYTPGLDDRYDAILTQ